MIVGKTMKIFFQPDKYNKSMDNLQDWNQCLERVGQHRDKAAFAALFTHFSPLLKSFLLKQGGAANNNVEEIIQETMIKVWRKAENYSSAQGAASTWIFTIARNTRIDAIRSQARQNADLLDADDIYNDSFERQESQTPQTSLVRVRDQKNIKEHLGELPQEQAEVLTLMYFEGKSGQQVADHLDLPLGTVKSRIRLALKKMKLALAPMQDAQLQTAGTNA